LRTLPEIANNEPDVADEINDSLDLGGVESKPPISLKQMEFYLKQFAKGWGSPTLVH
jgi:hypothetical protein